MILRSKSLIEGLLGLNLFLSGGIALAEDNVGSMIGHVRTSRGPAGKAQITVTNKDTGLIRSVMADEYGKYNLPALPFGTYEVTIAKEGFAEEKRTTKVRIGDRAVVDITLADAGTERVTVTGMIAAIDVTSTEAGAVFTKEELEKVPIASNTTAVSLLAPGATLGDARFGNLPTFNGSTVAENQYYLNGLNISNFNKRLGGSSVPWEFIDEFQVKTGGYSAEFGRSTGGVVNAISKKGSNTPSYGAKIEMAPAALGSHAPNVKNRNGTYTSINEFDSSSSMNTSLYGSGPLVKDQIFGYFLVAPNSGTSTYDDNLDFKEDTQSGLLWATKLDGYITPDHLVQLTAFSDAMVKETTTYKSNIETVKKDTKKGKDITKSGGTNYSIAYNGNLSEMFSLGVLYGVNKIEDTTTPEFDTPYVTDRRSGTTKNLGNWTSILVAANSDTRTSMRVDADVYLHDHELRLGIDQEKLNTKTSTRYSGNIRYTYQKDKAGNEYVQQRYYRNEGDFNTVANALYIQDHWTAVDNVVFDLGLRSEAFTNSDAAGRAFIEMNGQIAPRVGAAWDVMGDGRSKIFFNYGRYHLPVPNNTNVRLAGSEELTSNNYKFESIHADGTPVLGDIIGVKKSFGGAGEVADTGALVDKNIKPMFQDEYAIGYRKALFGDWGAGIRYISRDLKSTIEDMVIDAGLAKAVTAEGGECTTCSGFHYYVLGNPGNSITVTLDPDGDEGPLPMKEYVLSNDLLGYKKPTRHNIFVELVLQKRWSDKWSLDASYLWGRSAGNYEGFVKSDIGQADPGLTEDFDLPGLNDGANGLLPNDRTHTLKVSGAYEWMDITFGANFLAQSGRPKSGYGVHPTDELAQQYGNDSHYVQGRLSPRGSNGRTDFIKNIDVSFKYPFEIGLCKAYAKLDIFNLLDAQGVLYYNEQGDEYQTIYPAAPNLAEYNIPVDYQGSRYMLLTTAINF